MKFYIAGLMIAATTLTGCQNMADRLIDNYFERKGEEVIEQTIDRIVKRKRDEARKAEEGPSLEEQLKNPVKVSIENAPIKGDKDAAITIVEFSDFQCPFCTRVLPTIDQVMKEYAGKVNLAFRHNPLPFHAEAVPAAAAAVAAQKQGKFWEMHDLLFQNQRDLKEENLKKLAQQLKLDMKKFNADRAKEDVKKMIQADAEFARSNGAGGTPSFFIGKRDGNTVNGVLVVGAQPFEKFKEVIDAVMKM
jgi:protein-disulfide isomerase